MLISELSRQTGLTPDTIRFYEKKGLLSKQHLVRRDNNYKDYSADALERLRLVSQAKCAGFTLSEIEQWFREWDTLNAEQRRQVLLDKINQIENRAAELDKMKAYLTQLMPSCLAKASSCP